MGMAYSGDHAKELVQGYLDFVLLDGCDTCEGCRHFEVDEVGIESVDDGDVTLLDLKGICRRTPVCREGFAKVHGSIDYCSFHDRVTEGNTQASNIYTFLCFGGRHSSPARLYL